MKKYLTLIFAACILFACNNKPSIDNSRKRNENWCWFVDKETEKGEWIHTGDETTVKDGKYTLFFSNGVIRQKGKLKKGEDCDTIFYYDIYGSLIRKAFQDINGEFKDIIPDGKYKSYYANCEISIEGEYKNNKIVGKRTEYYKNGKLKVLIWYKNGLKNGIRISYYDNGQIETKCNYINGVEDGICIWYYDNGQVDSKCNFIGGVANGIRTDFYENGALKYKGQYVNGKEDGEIMHYFENGEVERKIVYGNEPRQGEMWIFYPNGQLKEYATSKNDFKTYSRSYNEDGKLIKEYDR